MTPQASNVLDQIQARAATDPDFRARLKADPRGTIEGATGAQLPAGINLRVVEQRSDEVFIVLPAAEAPARELADSELDQVAGATKYCWDTKPICWDTKDCLFFTL